MRNAIIVLALFFSAVAGAAVESSLERPASAAATAGAQDAAYLDRRISLLETKIYSIESSVRTLEQQAMMLRSGSAQPARDPETTLLRGEVEILKSRMRELECALARLDERTLSAAAKESRKRAGAQPQEPCRLDAETPLQISPRR